MFGTDYQDRLLANLFDEQYGRDAGAELHRFLENLKQVTLPFEFREQVRCREYPGFPGFECGLPPKYYYFVPGSCYGGHNLTPDDPLNPSFVAVADGIGLNFGCPLRLKRALAVVLSLQPMHQTEPRRGLLSSTKHLPTVEELIWASIWISPCEIERPETTGQKSHDWQIEFPDSRFNMECKFTPASWAALVDGDAFALMRGALAKKASLQLPNPVPSRSINIVAITGIAPVNDQLRLLCWQELNDYPNVQVIMYSDVVGQVAIFSLSEDIAEQVRKRVALWRADEYGGYATVASYRPETARRSAARLVQPVSNIDPVPKGLVEIPISHLPPRRLRVPPPAEYPYRFNLERRLASGEPIFEWVPPFLLAPVE